MAEVFLDERLWEKYVSEHPRLFLEEELVLESRQKSVRSGRLDLTFRDKKGNAVLVELQRESLDRNHFFKVLEYHKDLKNEGEENIRVVIVCNSIREDRDYFDTYRDGLSLNLEVRVIEEDQVKEIIKSIDPDTVFLDKQPKSKPKDKYDQSNAVLRAKTLSLQAELEDARNQLNKQEGALLSSLPPEIRDHIYRHTEYEYQHEWRDELVKLACSIGSSPKLEDVHHPIFGFIDSHNADYQAAIAQSGRRLCPLCHTGAMDITRTEIGWSVPVGMERHILGRGDRGCEVVRHLEWKYMSDHFLEVRKQRKERELALLEMRRSVEKLYLLGPFSEPVLDDHRLSYGKRVGRKKWDFARERLSLLGFDIVEENNVVRYTYSAGENIVYADPRESDRITFRVFKSQNFISDVYFLDQWHRHEKVLRSKFAERVLRPAITQ